MYVCKKRFIQLGSLNWHKKVHLFCNSCHMEIIQPQNFQEHFVQDKNTGKYACNKCNKRFMKWHVLKGETSKRNDRNETAETTETTETKRPKRNDRNETTETKRPKRNDRNETTETKRPKPPKRPKRNGRNETAETKRPKI